MTMFAGLDVGGKRTAVFVIDGSGKAVWRGIVDTHPEMIDAALQRIEDNTYGYCEETGEPISLKRLEARPIATLSVEAQERHEKREKVYRDE